MSFIKASNFDAHSLAGLLFLLLKCHFAPKSWQSGQPAIALFLSLLLGPLLRSSPTVLRGTLLRSFESVLRMWIWIWVFSVDICQGQSFCRRLVSFLHMQQDKLKLVHHAKALLNPSCLLYKIGMYFTFSPCFYFACFQMTGFISINHCFTSFPTYAKPEG